MNIEIHRDPNGEWAALYVDGRLERVGDAYRVEERAFELLGVVVLHDNAFLRGQDQRGGCAQTLEQVDAYRAEREMKRIEAERLRAQAADLVARAVALENGIQR